MRTLVYLISPALRTCIITGKLTGGNLLQSLSDFTDSRI